MAYSDDFTQSVAQPAGPDLSWLLWVALGVGLVIVGVLIAVWIQRRRQFLRDAKVTDKRAIKITLPKPTAETDQRERRDPKEVLGVMESVYASLQHFLVHDKKEGFWLGQPTFSFEIVAHHGEIYFYVIVPTAYADSMERIIHAQYPSAHLEPATDFDIFLEHGTGEVALGAVSLAKSRIFPVKTYRTLENDPLSALTSALSKVGGGTAAIQVLVQPTDQSWQKETEQALQNIQQGKSFNKNKDSALGKVLEISKDIGESAWYGQSQAKNSNEAQNTSAGNVRLTALQEQQTKLLVEKGSKVGLQTQVRVIARSDTKLVAKGVVQTMLSAFSQFQAPESNHFKVANLDDQRLTVDYLARSFSKHQSTMLLSTEELTGIFHFPNRLLETPSVHWLGARKLSPPNNLPTSGLRIGYSSFRGAEQPIFLKQSDRMRHFYMIGKTGVGKTNMFQNMVIQDIRNGEGVCYMDPNGDAIEWILRHIPKERAEDVVLFDPSDTLRPVALNLLEYDPEFPEQKSMLINEMMAVFDKLYDLKATGGPMFESYMRSAMLLVMDDPESGSSLMEIPRVLSDEAFRQEKLAKCRNQIVIDFWTKEAEKAGGDASLQNMVPYITSKLNQFTTNDIMRPIIGQQKSAFNFRDIMDNRKILLVSLPKGLLGEINQMLLGLIITARIQLTAFSRQNVPEAERIPFYLYVDEFQDFTSKTFATILAQARKYQLSLNFTNQLMGQLDDEMRAAVIGNVGTTLVWRIGANDADYLTKEFAPLSIDDMVNVERFNFYIKMLIDGTPTEPFNAIAYPPDPYESNELGKAVKELSRLKYGRDREVVEAEIRLRARGLL